MTMAEALRKPAVALPLHSGNSPGSSGPWSSLVGRRRMQMIS